MLNTIRCVSTPGTFFTEVHLPFVASFPHVRKVEEYLRPNLVWNPSFPNHTEGYCNSKVFTLLVQVNTKNTKSFWKLICKVFEDEPKCMGEIVMILPWELHM